MKLRFEDVAHLRQEPPTHFNYVDKIGNRYGKLVVLFYAGKAGARNKHQFVCICDCGFYTIVSTLNLRDKARIKSCGCSQSLWKTNIDVDLINERILNVETTTPYSVVDYGSGKYDRDKWTFKCGVHGTFKTTYHNVVTKGTRCPSCACLSRGFNQMIPGTFYLNIISDYEKPIALKYGITNSTVDKRIRWLEFGTSFSIKNVYQIKFVKGQDALELESSFCKKFGGRFLTKEELQVGFTETVNHTLLAEALDWLNNNPSNLKK